jgi:hypothetical protein
MATVTGFTAERMLVIENETVIDGEVQGDNLLLMQRGGAVIDTGNVRGPKGDTGDTGAPGMDGIINSVNDESIPHVYSPRIFANKAAIDGWTTAPIGSIALASDNTVMWEKDSAGWFIVNSPRIFASIAERDSRWPNAPDGALCQAPIGTEFRRSGGVWLPVLPTFYHYQWTKAPASVPASAYADAGVGPVNPFFTTIADGSNTKITLSQMLFIAITFNVAPNGATGSSSWLSDAPSGVNSVRIGGNSQGNQIGGGVMVSGPHCIAGCYPVGKIFYCGTRNAATAGGMYLTVSISCYPIGAISA